MRFVLAPAPLACPTLPPSLTIPCAPMERARLARGFLAATILFAVALALALPHRSIAQAPCNRSCDASKRDSYGCCPGAPAAPPAPPAAPSAPAACTGGQVRNTDTAGHCCWPGQGWAGGCVGTPTQCPAGFVATASSCELPACQEGRARTPDGVHCCWPGQAWVASRSTCVGAPTCPAGLVSVGEGCVHPCPAGMAGLAGGTFAPGDRHDTVTVQPLCMDVTEVTADAYTACVRAGQCTEDHPGQRTYNGESFSADFLCNYGAAGRGSHPMNCVDWAESSKYCRAQGKRLPTEEEWEWAARGQRRGTVYPWGDDVPGSQACWSRSRQEGTCAVGSYPAGDAPGGIHDLVGSVSEWTATDYGDGRICRGGAWDSTRAFELRAAARGHGLPPSQTYADLGFRCVR